MYLCACLIICNDFMFCFVVFGRKIVHICIFCFYAGCCRWNVIDLSDFLCPHFPFRCFYRRCIVVILLSAFSFALLQLFLTFFLLGPVLDFLLNESVVCINLGVLVFVLFGVVVCFFCLLLTYTHPYRTTHPLVCHYSPHASSLIPSTILANYVMFSCP